MLHYNSVICSLYTYIEIWPHHIEIDCIIGHQACMLLQYYDGLLSARVQMFRLSIYFAQIGTNDLYGNHNAV